MGEKRLRRRRATALVVRRRRLRRQRAGAVVHEQVGAYAKWSGSCACVKRRPGRPRLSTGCSDDRRRIYEWRKLARELDRLLALGLEPEAEEVERLGIL